MVVFSISGPGLGAGFFFRFLSGPSRFFEGRFWFRFGGRFVNQHPDKNLWRPAFHCRDKLPYCFGRNRNGRFTGREDDISEKPGATGMVDN